MRTVPLPAFPAPLLLLLCLLSAPAGAASAGAAPAPDGGAVGAAPAHPAASSESPARSIPPCSWTALTDVIISNVGSTFGVAWVDFDTDGDDDLYFAKAPGLGGDESRLLRNDGAGDFVFLSSSELATLTDDVGSSWGDYDNDGDPDCYLVSNGLNSLWRNDGGGAFTDVTTAALAKDTAGPAAWADIDGDGDLDLYVAANGIVGNSLYRNDGGNFVIVPSAANVFRVTQSATFADYDNDGDPDLFVSSNGGSNFLFRNDPGGFVEETAPPLDDTGLGHGAAWADYDNDGWLDLYLANLGGQNHLYHNDGNGLFTDVSTPPLNDAGLNGSVAWGDYDNDGYPDLYVDDAFALNLLLHNDLVFGEFHFTDQTSGPLIHVPLGGGLGWSDFDRDGDLDLAIATLQFDQPNRLFRNDCPLSNNWLQVKLEGVVSNRDGIGARLRAVDGKFVQHRHVESSSGLYGQNSLVAQFGFGLASRRSSSVIDSLIVTWPSGIEQVITGIAVNQRITVVEDSTTTALLVSGFRAEPRAGVVHLEWFASSDHPDDGFLVFRAPARDGPWRRLNDRALRPGNPVRYTDRRVEPLSTYFYLLENASGRQASLTEPLRVDTPFWNDRVVVLEPARPNPFAGGTELAFSLPSPGRAALVVYDIGGRRVATVARGIYGSGRQTVRWDGQDDAGRRLPAGVYLYRLETDGHSEARRLIRLAR